MRILGFILFGSIFLIQSFSKVYAQASVCPSYTENFEYKTMIKFCPGGGGSFQTWEDCAFHAGSICPCPTQHEQPCPGQA